MGSRIKQTLHRLPARLILRFSRHFVVEGVDVAIFLQDRSSTDTIVTKIRGALRLIQMFSPKQYSRIQKFTPTFLIFGMHPYAATYIRDLRLCDIARDYILKKSTTSACLAMTFAHEATHG